MVDKIFLCVCVTSVFTWILLLFMPARWIMSERWEAADNLKASITKWPKLSVIIPARNESLSLPITLPSWLEQNYPEAEVILIDDNSNDGTAECARNVASRSNRTIQILRGTPPPSNWTGKLWALQQGVNVSSGKWLLFTDADIWHRQNLWRGLVAKAITEQRAMVSLMALLDTKGAWASLLIPAFVYFFHILYPFRKVGDSRSGVSAAAGGCILISRFALDKIGGIAGYCDAWIDDIALARRIKSGGMPLSLSLTKSVVSIRPYSYLREVWHMVARNAFSQLNYSWLALIGTLLGLFVLFLSPLVGICMFAFHAVSFVVVVLSFTALLLMAVTYIPVLRFFNLGIIRTFTLPCVGMLYLAMTISSAIDYLVGKREWRGVRIETHE